MESGAGWPGTMMCGWNARQTRTVETPYQVPIVKEDVAARFQAGMQGNIGENCG